MFLKKLAMQAKMPSGLFGHFVANRMIKGNRPYSVFLLNELKLRGNEKILEIGYGSGIGIKLLMEQNKSCSVYGIDFSELMYRKAGKLNKSYVDNNKVHLFCGDFLTSGINTAEFDIIFCLNVIYFWDELSEPFTKIRTLLKENGTFHFYMAGKEELDNLKFATNNNIFNKRTIEQVTESLASAGFHNINHIFEKGYYISAKK